MENKFELIEKYLSGDMSVGEQLEFDNLLRNDPELMKELLLRKEVNDAILEDDIIKLRNTINEITQSDFKLKRKSLNPILISTLAAIFLILIVVSSIFISREKVNDKDLFNTYYQKYPSIINSRSSAESEQEKLFLEAFQEYEMDNFEEASLKFNKLLIDDNSNYLLLFYLSICELENNNLKNSENYLKTLTQNRAHIFWEQAHWYLALNYLHQNDIENSSKILKIIVQENMSKKREAELILKDLN